MAVRAKFRVTSVESELHSRQLPEGKDEQGRTIYRSETVEKRTVKLAPVYSQDPDSENRAFWDATPTGKLELGVINPEAWTLFDLGGEYYLDITQADV